MEDVKLNNNTYVSLGVVVLLLGAIVSNQVQLENIKSKIDTHQSDKSIHRDMELIRRNFISRNELELQLENINLKMERILDKLDKED